MISLVRRGSELRAAVEGSDYAPYQVRVSFDNVGVAEASCTCPYNWGGWCKHIVATLLTCLDRPEVIEVRPSLEELLAGLEREQLQALLLSLAAGRPDLVEAIEGQIELLRVAPTGRVDEAASGVDDLAPDPRLIRRQVRATMHSLDQMRRSEAYWHVGRVVDEIRQLLKQAQDLVEAGRGRAALALLEAITEEYLEGWEILDDSDGEVGGFFLDLGNAWLEAIVATE